MKIIQRNLRKISETHHKLSNAFIIITNYRFKITKFQYSMLKKSFEKLSKLSKFVNFLGDSYIRRKYLIIKF